MYESAILLMIASLLPRGTTAGNPDGDVTGMSFGWLKQEQEVGKTNSPYVQLLSELNEKKQQPKSCFFFKCFIKMLIILMR